METLKIDQAKTLDKIREQMSVLAWCRNHDVAPRFFYMVVSQERGFGGVSGRGRKSVIAERIVKSLQDEGLLVELPAVPVSSVA